MLVFWIVLFWCVLVRPGPRQYEAGAGPPRLPLATSVDVPIPRAVGVRMEVASTDCGWRW